MTPVRGSRSRGWLTDANDAIRAKMIAPHGGLFAVEYGVTLRNRDPGAEYGRQSLTLVFGVGFSALIVRPTIACRIYRVIVLVPVASYCTAWGITIQDTAVVYGLIQMTTPNYKSRPSILQEFTSFDVYRLAKPTCLDVFASTLTRKLHLCNYGEMYPAGYLI